ncbi:MAG TPA: glycine cleavage system protein R [Gammaproteobacteria bacterium]|jgi:glycine cleavage system transcriptional repressor|nr:glycine cleavage system protein R [Gammaproteobacteria bacterium]
MKQFLVVSVLAQDRPGILHDLARVVRDCGCNVVESRMTVLGGEFSMLLLVSGNWNTVTKLESTLPKLEKSLGLTLSSRRTGERAPREDLLPYAVDVVCLDQPGIIFNLANFFAERNIGVAELSTRSYTAAHTGAPMFAVQMSVNIPADTHVGRLREDFMEFCDNLNLDAIMEPIKG